MKKIILNNLKNGQALDELAKLVIDKCETAYPEMAVKLMRYFGMRINAPSERNYIICDVTPHKAVSGELYCIFIAFDRDDPHKSFFVEVGDQKCEEKSLGRKYNILILLF